MVSHALDREYCRASGEGYPPEVIAKALEVASAAETVFESDFKSGFPKLDELRAKYGSEPWFKDVHGDFAFFVLQHSDAELKAQAANFNTLRSRLLKDDPRLCA